MMEASNELKFDWKLFWKSAFYDVWVYLYKLCGYKNLLHAIRIQDIGYPAGSD